MNVNACNMAHEITGVNGERPPDCIEEERRLRSLLEETSQFEGSLRVNIDPFESFWLFMGINSFHWWSIVGSTSHPLFSEADIMLKRTDGPYVIISLN